MKHENLNVPMSIVISGVEGKTYWDIVVNKAKMGFVLMSYHYLQSKKGDFLKERIEENPHVKVFIDSGAHTFLTNEKYLDMPNEFWEDYLEKYTAWLIKNKDYIFACANLDLEAIVGNELVDEWNDKYFKKVEEAGIQVCYIWHSPRGEIGWEEMCRKHSYIGLSIQNDTDTTLQKLMKKIKVAQKYNTRVHGMALTKTDILVRVPFFSADSSVDGDSKVLVRYKTKNPTVPYKVELLSIKELYDRNLENEFRTFDFETRVPYKDVEVLTVDNNNKTIWGSLYGVVKHLVKKPTVKLRVQGGKDVICTTDHSIITMNDNGELVETKADSLKVGDYVLSTKINNAFKDNNDKNALWINNKQYKMTDNALQTYGLWIGDGHISENYVGFSCLNDAECVKPIKSFMDRKGNKIVRSKSNNVDGRVHSVDLVRQFKDLDLVGKSHSKKIPSWVFSLSERQIGQFLKGYFSADGTAPCELSTVSKELKDGVVTLLEMMGIYTSVSYRPSHKFIKDNKTYQAKESWKITVKDVNSLKLFKEKVGFLQKYKMDKLEAYINSKEPRQARREEKPSNIKVDVDGLTFLKIKSIEPIANGEDLVEVYDLSVKDYERFFANGILVHNTTWLVGQQYGELNWFDGRKMRRLGKTEWRRNYKTKLLKEPFNADWDRLINGMGGKGDTYELLRLNLVAYKLVEEHIRKRNFSKMYWMKGGENNSLMPVSHKSTTELNLNLPPYEWYVDEEEKYPDLDKYLNSMGISPNDFSREESVNILFFYFLLLQDTENHIDEFEDDILTSYASQLSNSVISSRDEAIQFLTTYYRENALGIRNDFKGENSVLAPKEREIYVEEDEFATIDLSSSDIEHGLGIDVNKDDMPEITLLDEELRKQDIMPVRDSKGRFIKGQKKVRKPKNIYSDKMPVLNCNTCYKAGDCEMYKPGYVCAYKKMFKRFNTRNMDDIIDAMTSMANYNLERMSRAMMFETMDGGMVTAEVTGLIDQNMRILNQIKDLQNSRAVVSQRKVIREDGTEETVTHLNVNPQEGGILSKIFGMSKSNEEEDKDKYIDVDYKE